MTSNTLHSVEFFDLQLRFAVKVAELCDISLADAVGRYTNVYVRLGMGPHVDVNNPDWLCYLEELCTSREPAAFTHAVHRSRLHLPIGPPHVAAAGCFSYAHAGLGLVGCTFGRVMRHRNRRCLPRDKQIGVADLRCVFATLQATQGADVQVVGASWLYNLPAYRRLFPDRHLDNLQAIAHPYQRMPLWGQFLNRDRSVRRDVAARFLADVERASGWHSLAACFPLQVLATKSPAPWMYEHLDLALSSR